MSHPVHWLGILVQGRTQGGSRGVFRGGVAGLYSEEGLLPRMLSEWESGLTKDVWKKRGKREEKKGEKGM